MSSTTGASAGRAQISARTLRTDRWWLPPLATFVGDTLRAQDGDAPDHHLADWTRDLLEGRHPAFTPADATVVTDARTGEIVSCLHLLSQTWSYGGVPISVGQPELIGTLTARRAHGLVRAQFEVHHCRAAARGHQSTRASSPRS